MNYYPYLAMIAISCLTIKNAVKRNPPENRSIWQLVSPQSPTGQQGVRKRERTPYFDSITKGFPLRFPFNVRADYFPDRISGGVEFLKKTHPNIYATDEEGNTVLQLAIIHGCPFKELKQFVEKFQIDIHHKNASGATAFILAAQRGDRKILEYLKKKGANVNDIDNGKCNALHCAIDTNRSLKLIEWLIDAGVDKNAKGSFYKENGQYHKSPPFIQAAVARNLPLLKLLLKKGVDVHTINSSQNNALHEAILAFKTSEDMAIIKWLIEVAKISIDKKGTRDRSPFLLAAPKGNLELLQFLKKKGANVNDSNFQSENALHIAILYNHPIEVIEWLIDAKVNMELKRSPYENTPFILAAVEGNLPVLKLLLKKGANPQGTSAKGDNALHYAIHVRGYGGHKGSEDIPMIEWLIDTAQLSVNGKGADGKTPFIYAAEYGDLDMLNYLLTKKADAHATDDHGDNALHWSIRSIRSNQKSKKIEWLIDTIRLPINAKGADGKTPFIYAGGYADLDILKYLLAKGADAHATDHHGNNALIMATSRIRLRKDLRKIAWLIDTAKIPVNSKGSDGTTPFIHAVKKEHTDLLIMLKEAGADVHAKDNFGRNALSYAQFKSTIDCLKKKCGFRETWILQKMSSFITYVFGNRYQ